MAMLQTWYLLKMRCLEWAELRRGSKKDYRGGQPVHTISPSRFIPIDRTSDSTIKQCWVVQGKLFWT